MFENFSFSNIIENGGIFISVVGYVVVFISLLTLSIIVANIKTVLSTRQRKKLKEVGHRAADMEDLDITGEINAAIAMAIHQHYAESHDFESTVLTIKKAQKVYSPWSSKLYGLRQTPKK